jgi:protein-S-isoprenylcysteine O-methyltransferase Ste14
MTRVAEALHIPPSLFVDNPKCKQFEFEPADAIFLLNAGFGWPKPDLRLWLDDGVGELDLGSAADVYGVSAAYQIRTQSTEASVVSRHGIQFVPREQVQRSAVTSEVGVPGAAHRSEGTRQFAYIAAIEDLARRQDVWTARFTAKRLEIRTPLRIEGDSVPIRVMLAPFFIGCAALGLLLWLRRRILSQGPIGLELKIPPLALVVIVAALMWCTRSATPDFDLPFSSDLMVPAALAILGALTCLAGVVAFRRARTTVNPLQPNTTSSLVVSGIYRYTRNPMYLGFLLLLMAWALALSNLPAIVLLPVFVLYMNRCQIMPEERMLTSRFEQDYARYRAKVRRWL